MTDYDLKFINIFVLCTIRKYILIQYFITILISFVYVSTKNFIIIIIVHVPIPTKG